MNRVLHGYADSPVIGTLGQVQKHSEVALMSFDLRCGDALNDNTPKLSFLSEGDLEYHTLAAPSLYEPASIKSDLAESILNALSRDDRLRWAYLRRRWQGFGD